MSSDNRASCNERSEKDLPTMRFSVLEGASERINNDVLISICPIKKFSHGDSWGHQHRVQTRRERK